MKTYNIKNEKQTLSIAQKIAAQISAPCFIALSGDLGAGKSVLARAIIQNISNNPSQDVPSPTFTLVQQYETERGLIWHFDLYRLDQDIDVHELGWDDALFDGICLVEWPERAGHLLPEDRIDINLKVINANERIMTITAQGETAAYEL